MSPYTLAVSMPIANQSSKYRAHLPCRCIFATSQYRRSRPCAPGKDYVCGGTEPTIADFAIFPWIRCNDKFYDAKEFLQMDSYVNVKNWCERLEAGAYTRPIVSSPEPFLKQ